MAVSNIYNYAGILITASGGLTLTGGASNVEANWDTSAQLWDGGVGKRYIFWGDTVGEINVFEFNFSSEEAANFTLITNAAYSGAALSITICYTSGVNIYDVMKFPDCVYNPGMENRRLRAMGDRLVLEEATNYRILKVNND
jgi:hypothetical protein